MVGDPVADILIRIKNGYMAFKEEVTTPYSKLTFNICNLLLDEGYINEYKKENQSIRLVLKYNNRVAVLTDVKRISKPGLRVYKKATELPRVLNGLGFAIISTPKGLMSEKKARKMHLGGEVMALVW